MMNGQGLTVKELASLLELTPRRIQQLAKEGTFPKIERGKYALDECVRAYVQYWQERAEGRFTESELDQTRLQKEHLEVRKRAVQVARAEGSVVGLDDHEEVIRKLLGAVRAVLLGIPGAWSARVVGIGTPVEGLVLMTKLADEVVEGVAASANTFEIEDSFQPELIIELGTWMAGVTLVLHEAFPQIPLYTYDSNTIFRAFNYKGKLESRVPEDKLREFQEKCFGGLVHFGQGNLIQEGGHPELRGRSRELAGPGGFRICYNWQ